MSLSTRVSDHKRRLESNSRAIPMFLIAASLTSHRPTNNVQLHLGSVSKVIGIIYWCLFITTQYAVNGVIAADMMLVAFFKSP